MVTEVTIIGETERNVNGRLITSEEEEFVTRLKSNANDAAAFCSNGKVYTWGALSAFRVFGDHCAKEPILAPQQLRLKIAKDMHQRMYALSLKVYNDGHPDLPKSIGRLDYIEEVTSIMSIDWGLSHCVFVDNMGRVFSFGSNRDGKTGLANTFKKKM